LAAVSKGERTRQHATTVALELATTVGIEQVTVGTVAERSGLSKSGLYAHFGSRTAMQIAALDEAGVRMRQVVHGLDDFAPGIARLRGFFSQWLGWSAKAGLPGGCPATAALFELDDVQGPVRDYVADEAQWLLATLAAYAREAIDAKEFRTDTDVGQVAWELQSLYLGHHVSQRFLRDPHATDRAIVAFDALVDRNRRP
jgi:AcrR family transcriptional regulator